jgi:hypothetical protein
MMRFGIARLAASFASPSQPTTTNQLTAQVVKYLTASVQLDTESVEAVRTYLAGKPGSTRYTPLRRALEAGDRPLVERQDIWLAQPGLRSSVGALTKNYYEDALGLAHVLGLVRPRNNLLLSRGRLCAFPHVSQKQSPFVFERRQALLLGLWLIDVDGDWIWALLREIGEKAIAEITVENRVDILLGTIERLLTARQLVSGAGSYVAARARLRELDTITRRNQREGLNLGQPWSWFLIPRLELLVDALVFDKAQPEDLTGYRLSPAGVALSRRAASCDRGEELLRGFFAAHHGELPSENTPFAWPELRQALERVAPLLRTATGYYPLFESAAAACVERAERGPPYWEIPQVETTVREHGKGAGAEVVLSIDKQGAIQSFKFKE